MLKKEMTLRVCQLSAGVGRDPAQSGSDLVKFEFTARYIRSACMHVHSYTREVWRNAFKSLDSI